MASRSAMMSLFGMRASQMNVMALSCGVMALRAPYRRCSTGTSGPTPGKVRVHVTTMEGKAVDLIAPVGMTLMEAIRDVGRVDMEAACDGTCACSTCHVIMDEESYAKLPEPPSEDELDMLDLAPSVTKTSRLSCQVQLTESLDGLRITIPDEMENQLR